MTSERTRGRPPRSSGRPALTRQGIADAALDLAAEHGFPALTMRSLADRMGVTVRALYHHVASRQEVIELVAATMMSRQPHSDLDPATWRIDVRTLYREARDAYRGMGRATLFALDETLAPGEAPAERILLAERLLAFLTDVGLSLPQALAWRAQFLVDVFGYALLVDHRYDRGSSRERRGMQDPVPLAWLQAHPQLEAPLSWAATSLPPFSPDDLFEQVIDRAVGTIDAFLGQQAGTGRDRPAVAEPRPTP